MGATWYVLRSRWRRGVAGQLVLALVVALAGTMVLATLAGARRTETAYDRFVDESKNPEVFLDTAGGAGVVYSEAQIQAVRDLPQVVASSHLRAMAMQSADDRLYQPTAAPLDDVWGHELAISRFVEGRQPTEPDEFSLTEQRADLLGLSLGDTLTMESYTPEQIEAAKSGDDSVFADPQGPLIDLTLVGIVRTISSVASDRDIASITMLTPTFLDQHGYQIGSWSDLLVVDLREGDASISEFTDALHAIPGLEDVRLEAGGGAPTGPSETLGFVATSLRVLAGIAALAGIATLTLLMSRTASAQAAEDAVLAGVGFQRGGRRRVLLLGNAPGSLIGLAVTVVGAVGASTLFPFGLGGRAEPDPGIDVDPVLLAIAVGVMAGVLLVTAWAVSVWAVRGTSRGAGPARRSWVVGTLARAGAPYPLVVGGRFVLERGAARRGMPARAAIAGVALGSAGLVAVLVFTSSQAWLIDNPGAWGRPWDIAASGELTGPEIIPPAAVQDRSDVLVTVVEIDGHPLEARGVEVIEGTSLIEVSEGRAPGPGEVVLGAAVLEELGVGIGDAVTMSGSRGEAELQIVGQGMFSGLADVPILDVGAALDQATLDRIADPEEGFSTQIIRLAGDADREAIFRAVAEAEAESNGLVATEADVERITMGDRPDEFARLDEVQFLPWLLAGFLGLIAVTATSALLVSAVDRRRHDMAILRSAGLEARGLRAIVMAQATIVSVFGLVIGVPLGLVIGRAVWRYVAEDLGVQVHLTLPVVPVLATILVVVLVDVVVSLIPARRAARAHPVDDLRAE